MHRTLKEDISTLDEQNFFALDKFTGVIYKYIGCRMIAVRLPSEIEKRLDQLAKETGRSKTYYVREAILEHLDDLEDIYLAEKRLIEFRAGRSSAVALEELLKENGLAD
jgi:RHH-type rel operon transcriptional repressor/antitoxin RelB